MATPALTWSVWVVVTTTTALLMAGGIPAVLSVNFVRVNSRVVYFVVLLV